MSSPFSPVFDLELEPSKGVRHARQRQTAAMDRSRSEYRLCQSKEQQVEDDGVDTPLQKIFRLFHSTTSFELQVSQLLRSTAGRMS